MTRRQRLLLGLVATVGTTQLFAWALTQLLVVRPAIRDREPLRIQQTLTAAERVRGGQTMERTEAELGLDLRLEVGPPEGPPLGDGWVAVDAEHGRVWKRDGGEWDIAAWSGSGWVVLHEDPPYTSLFALALLVSGVPVVLVAFGVSQRASRQLETAEATLASMAAGQLDHRLAEDVGTREMRRVAVAVNQMAHDLSSLMAIERQRMAGLSHELRTPLTRIRLDLELARRDGVGSKRLNRIERNIEAFDQLLTELLELSRLELGGVRSLRREVVDLHGLARLVVQELADGDVEVRGAGAAFADSALIARALQNLLRNSAAHAPGSRRWVAVSEGAVEVGDDGPGIAESDHARILRPFERSATSKGHGVGLAIVAEIVALHGGTLTLSAPPGLVVRITLPPDEA
jgi:signal transduction histidine kinase